MPILGFPVNAIALTCCSAAFVNQYPVLLEPMKLATQALMILACSYVINGKENHNEAHEIVGYRVMKWSYLFFVSTGVASVLEDLTPYLSEPRMLALHFLA